MLRVLRIAWVDGLAPILIATIFVSAFYSAKAVLACIYALHCAVDWFNPFDD